MTGSRRLSRVALGALLLSVLALPVANALPGIPVNVRLPLAGDDSPPTADPAAAEAAPESVADGGGELALENAFVSSTGWVKPGDSYPFRLLVTNAGAEPQTGAVVTLAEVPGMTITDARSATGTVTVEGGAVTWDLGEVAGATDDVPTVASLVVEAAAAGFDADPEIVWKNLSTTATLTYDGGPEGVTATSHGPKVIPPDESYDTARYGDRPFPVVPVDYADFQHAPESTAEALDEAINGRENPGSTFNLYQEMSLGQLFTDGVIGSLGIDEAPVEEGDDLRFSTFQPGQTCTGVTAVDPTSGEPGPTYTTRVRDGWYQLPGTRSYYGQDGNGSALVGAVAGIGALQQIDSGCGPAAKAAYDAAVAADPDIDFSDFDTDKDGVVDFFEVIFQGPGGNGDSQTTPGTDLSDNVWPHSSSLEFSYTDPETGLTGYISDDQLRDVEDRPLWYTDESRTTMTTDDMGDELKVFVRVGPYNVNPETAIEKASVISHEYGHSLGMPDFYSTGSRETYGDFTLMATDKSQNMDVFAKQELGWIVPRVLEPGETVTEEDWPDSKTDIGSIEWVTPDGTPYTLSADNGDQGIHNALAYVASLPGRDLLDPERLGEASPTQVWHSGSGNDFGCAPMGGRNLDIVVPELEQLEPGTPVTLRFKSYWDIEWDYDYGFVLAGADDPATPAPTVEYTSVPSEMGYTTPATQNPNANSCLAKYGNGLTGSSGSYEAGTSDVDRVLGEYNDDTSTFVDDEYDLTDLAGAASPVIRFSYATDPGLARPGWFVDDLEIVAGDDVIWSSDFESDGGPDDERVYPGGCKDDLSSGGPCTDGWAYVQAGGASSADHAYFLEMRDRSGFDNEGRGENDREPIAFEPGLLLTYTDEAHGYGNVGTDDPPAQSPLDSQPEPGNATPDLSDATFTAGDGDGSFSDAASSPWLDNYSDPNREPTADKNGDEVTEPWLFDYDCLSFTVDSMTGEDTMSDEAPGDLAGTVTFTMGEGCAAFDYGFGAPAEEPVAEEPPADEPSDDPGDDPEDEPSPLPLPSAPAVAPPTAVAPSSSPPADSDQPSGPVTAVPALPARRL